MSNARSSFLIIPQLADGTWLPSFQVEAESSAGAAKIAMDRFEKEDVDYKYICVQTPPEVGESKYTKRPDLYPEFQYSSEKMNVIGGF